MNQEMLPSPREAAILDILINGELYGRQIRDEYEKRTRTKLSLGSLYVTLNRMETDGLIESRMGETTTIRVDNRRKYFNITGLGERVLHSFQIHLVNAMGGRLRCVT